MKKMFLKFIPLSGLLSFFSASSMEVRWWRERVIGFILALAAFWVYSSTLCPSVLPGMSALATASSLHTGLAYGAVGHPIANIVSHYFSVLPLGDIAWRLNLFSALCGAGAVFFLFRLVTLTLFDAMSEEHWVEQLDEDIYLESRLREVTAAKGGVTEMINAKGHRIAMAGGGVSALAFAFCAPFWIASTSFHFQTFQLLLLLATGYALVRYWATSYTVYSVVAALLLGLGLFESAYFIVFLPVAFLLLLSSGCRHAHISVPFIGLLALCFSIGILLACAVQVLWLSHGGCLTFDLGEIATLWVKGHMESLQSILTRKGWPLMLVQGLLPLIIVYAGRYHFVYTHLLSPSMEDSQEYADCDPEEHHERVSKLFWGMALFGLLVCVAHVLLNLPGSPWSFSRESAYLPVLPLLGIAMTSGFLLSFGLLIGSGRPFPLTRSTERTLSGAHPGFARSMSAGMVVVVCSLVIAAVFRNRGELEGPKALFVDRFCREILEAAPDAQCFITDGTFDMNLSVQARLQKREVTLLNIRDQRHWRSSALTGTGGAKKPTTEAFLAEWLADHPESCSQVAVLVNPRLWFAAGFQAVPGPLVYSGVAPDAKLELKALVNQQRCFWEKNKPLLMGEEPRSFLMRHLQSEMCAHLSRLANDLGVFCLHQGSEEEAIDAFGLALDMDPNNLCAQVNQYPYVYARSEKKREEESAFLERVDGLIARTPIFVCLSDWERHYGTLYLSAIEQLANQGTKLSAAEEAPKESPFMRRARDYVRESILATAIPRVSQQMSLKDGAIDEEVMTVVDAIMGGYSKAAESQLRNLLRKQRASLVAWALLAEVLMNQGNFVEVRGTVLPEMRFIAGDKGSEWIELTEGCLAMRQVNPDYRLAHDQFMRALQRKPDIEEARNLLLQAALLLGDETVIEADCNAVMKQSSNHPMANAALGALRLRQGRLEEAIMVLNVSIESRPSSAALNDLGEALRRLKRLQEAEAMTRRSLLLNPGFYQAWDTLALILRDQQRLDEAAEAHRAALRLCRSDIRLYLSAAQLAEKRGDHTAVRKLLQEAAPLVACSALSYQDRYSELLKHVSQLQQGR